jgi:putative protein kinase ArgK-like GTPase of G3E family
VTLKRISFSSRKAEGLNWYFIPSCHFLLLTARSTMAKDLTLQVDNLPDAILDLVRRVEKLLSRQAADPRDRILVALAGVPGSGKSTVSHALLAELAARNVHDVAVVPMVRMIPASAS